ncbi:MAG: sensor histidine kinase [Spirochaeta sp.]
MPWVFLSKTIFSPANSTRTAVQRRLLHSCLFFLLFLPSPAFTITPEDIISQSQIIMLLIEPESGRIVQANPAATDFYGYSSAQLTRMTVDDLNVLEENELRRLREQAAAKQDNAFEFQHQLADGTIRDVEVHSWPITSDDDSLLFSIILDITDRKAALEELHETHDRLYRAEEVADFGHWVFNFNTGVVEASPGAVRIYGLSDTLWNISRTQKIPLPEYREYLDTALKELIERDEPYNVRFRIKRPSDGQIRYIHSIAEYDRQRNIVFGIIRDYTDEALAQQELSRWYRIIGIAIGAAILILVTIILLLIRAVRQRRAANLEIMRMVNQKDMLLREVHHRIKNNMGTIMNLLSLQADSLDTPAAVTALDEARRRVQSMMVMYDKLYRSGEYAKLSMKEYLESLIEDITDSFLYNGRISIRTDILDFAVDTQKLFYLGILVNELLTNAIKYAFPEPHSGEIVVSASAKGEAAQVEVRDNGIGLPDGVGLEGPGSSSGFGLTLVSILTEQIGGRTEIRRDGGTRFRVYFETTAMK